MVDVSVKNLYNHLKLFAAGHTKYKGEVFAINCEPVERHAALHGLTQDEFHSLVSVLSKIDLQKSNALPSVALQRMIRLLIPESRPKAESVDMLVAWFMTYWSIMPRNATKTAFMWFIGALKFELIHAEDINWCYDAFCCGFDIIAFKLPLAKFLELITTPELVTRFRTQYLWNEYNKQKSQPLLHILSLFKTLRPDMVPMAIPVITSGFNSNAEKQLLEQLEVASVRAEQMGQNAGSFNFARIRWAIQKKRQNKKQTELLPQVSYNTQVSLQDRGKDLLQFETIKEVAANILSARTPAQILSLITNPEAIFYLKFQDDEVQSRFSYCLHMMFSTVETLYCQKQFEEDIEILLKSMITKQEIDQRGSNVITNFAKNFLLYNQNPQYLPLVLKLTLWPEFSSPEDLKTNTLVPMEQTFNTSIFRHKCLIIEALWSLAWNMLVELKNKQASEFEWSPTESLEMVYESLGKMYDHCIASKSLSSLDDLKMSGIIQYLELSEIESKLHQSFRFYTLAPCSLILSCFISGSTFLLEKSSKLVFSYRERSKSIPSAVKKRKKKELGALESIYHTLLDIFVDEVDAQSYSMLKVVAKDTQIPVISRRFMNKHKLLRHFGLLITRLVGEQENLTEWDMKDALEFCSNNLPHFTELLAILNDQVSDGSQSQ